MTTTLGPQSPATLAIGDRYVIKKPGAPRHEVTVSAVENNVDGSFTVTHLRDDPVRWARYTYGAGAVHVIHRAPRCLHGADWAECGRCADAEWPAEILAAFFGEAFARA